MADFINNSASFDIENIAPQLNELLHNVPDNVTLIEKIRWLYIKAGELFSYDYRIINDSSLAYKLVHFEDGFISRFQTCSQIAYLFDILLKNLDPSIKSEIFARRTDGRVDLGVQHYANLVILPDGTKYILDLTLDLYLIQSGCQTKQFGYTTDINGECDIIPLCDCYDMDQKMGLVHAEGYTDDKIKSVRERINSYDCSKLTEEQEIEFRIASIDEVLKSFPGYHEGKQFLNVLLRSLLGYNISYKEFNLFSQDEDKDFLTTCYAIRKNRCEKWYLYNNKEGLIETTKEKVFEMLCNGWSTKSIMLNSSMADPIMKRY